MKRFGLLSSIVCIRFRILLGTILINKVRGCLNKTTRVSFFSEQFPLPVNKHVILFNVIYSFYFQVYWAIFCIASQAVAEESQTWHGQEVDLVSLWVFQFEYDPQHSLTANYIRGRT